MPRTMIGLALTTILLFTGFVQAAEPVKLGLNYPTTGRYKQQ